MARDESRLLTTAFAPEPQRRNARGEHRRLGLLGRVELFIGTFLDQLPEVVAQHARSFLEGFTDGAVLGGKGRQHPDFLRTLTRKYEREGHAISIEKGRTGADGDPSPWRRRRILLSIGDWGYQPCLGRLGLSRVGREERRYEESTDGAVKVGVDDDARSGIGER